MTSKIDRLIERREALYKGGGEERIEKQHAAGKLTARERLALLLDENTFQETHLFMRHRCTHFGLGDKEFPGEGVVTGSGLLDGRPVYVASQDFTVAGGAVGEATARKIQAIMDDALKTGDPFIFINDSGGARIQEGVDSLAGYGGIFHRNVLMSGVVPQISVIAGPCAGGAAYSPALTDFIIQVRSEGQMFITGPSVIKQVTGEVVFEADSGVHAMEITKRLLSFLPSNNTEEPPTYESLHEDEVAPVAELNDIVPENPRQAYDMHRVIQLTVDNGDFLEVSEHWAPNIIVGFGRLEGATVGIVANNPLQKAGVLDIDSSDKAARHIRFCNAFNIPLITFVDVPGFLPGVQQEYGGIIRHGAKMLFAYGSATVPKITIIVRKAYGGAYLAMCGKDMGADRCCAWPTGEIAVMGAEGAVNVLYRREITEAADPVAERQTRIDEYTEAFANPYVAAARGLLDDIIEPAETRLYIAQSLQILKAKRELRPQKKHGLIPL